MTKTFKLNEKRTLRAMFNKSIRDLQNNVSQEERDLAAVKGYINQLKREEEVIHADILNEVANSSNPFLNDEFVNKFFGTIGIAAAAGVFGYYIYFINFVF